MKTSTIYPWMLSFFAIILSLPSAAQFYSAGQGPASLKWLQIHTENFQVIFPVGYEQQGKHIANVLEWSYEHATGSLEHEPRKVSVIVHNHTVVSNGFVSWAPARIELYGTPPANNDFHNWMERLAIHEFRHVVQIDKLNQGLTRLLGILFGEMGTGAVVAHLPLWFLEGDAVAMETALTRAGRGRMPRFEQGLRAQILTYGRYSFDKALFGSYRDHVPNYYELGYQLVAAARSEHGANAWSPVVDNTARRPWGLYPFTTEMRRQFGKGKIRHYNSTFRNLERQWGEQKDSHQYSQPRIIKTSNNLFASYHHPHWINDSLIVALKTGLEDIPAIVAVDNEGTERTLHRPGTVFSHSIHYNEGKVVWSELRPDPRWQHRSFAEIMVLDTESRKIQRLTRKTKFFSPALSPCATQIAVTEVSPENRNSLVLIDAENGEEITRYSYEYNDFIMQPAWHPSGEKLALVVLSDEGKRMDEIPIPFNEPKTLFKAGEADISSPVYADDDILFNATWSGIDNIYLLSRVSGNIYKAVSSVFGAVNASVNAHNAIVYSDYTAEGYLISVLPGDGFKRKPLEQTQDHSVAFHKVLSKQESYAIHPDSLPQQDLEIEKYSRLRNLFHLHSWFPAYLDVDMMEANPGASLLFQNKLSTSFAQLGYLWDLNEETGRFKASYAYHGWYPVVELSAETGERRISYTADEERLNFLFREDNVNLSLYIPLRFQRNDFFSGITPLMRFGVNNTAPNRNTADSIYVGHNQYLELAPSSFYTHEIQLLAFRQRRSMPRDIFPKNGQILNLHYRHTPIGGADMGNITAARGILYFPGLFKHHGIRLAGAFQYRERGMNEAEEGSLQLFYDFSNIVPYPRGITGQFHKELYAFSADYGLPLLYPDISIPYVMYLKRLKGYVFYDYAIATVYPDEMHGHQFDQYFSSYGFGISADMNVLGFFAPISAGVQVAFPEDMKPSYQLLFNVSL